MKQENPKLKDPRTIWFIPPKVSAPIYCDLEFFTTDEKTLKEFIELLKKAEAME